MKIKCQINAKSATFILWSPSYVIVSQLKFYNQHMFTSLHLQAVMSEIFFLNIYKWSKLQREIRCVYKNKFLMLYSLLPKFFS